MQQSLLIRPAVVLLFLASKVTIVCASDMLHIVPLQFAIHGLDRLFEPSSTMLTAREAEVSLNIFLPLYLCLAHIASHVFLRLAVDEKSVVVDEPANGSISQRMVELGDPNKSIINREGPHVGSA